MKIGMISDTHDLLRPEVTAQLQGCGCILHAGDISSRRILDQLEQIAPVRAVRGNNDGEWAVNLPEFLDFELAGIHFFMTHKKKDLPGDLRPYDLAVFGHSHQYASVWQEHQSGSRTLLLNPGSCGPRRFIQPITMAVLEADGDGWTVRRIDIRHGERETDRMTDPRDIYRQIETIIRETEKGRTADSIAGKHEMQPEFVEQVVRLYVTHPGVTADGIMTKLGALGKL